MNSLKQERIEQVCAAATQGVIKGINISFTTCTCIWGNCSCLLWSVCNGMLESMAFSFLCSSKGDINIFDWKVLDILMEWWHDPLTFALCTSLFSLNSSNSSDVKWAQHTCTCTTCTSPFGCVMIQQLRGLTFIHWERWICTVDITSACTVCTCKSYS